jgi:hypothetical protein
VERKYSQFVSINLDPGLPPRKLYDNLRQQSNAVGVDEIPLSFIKTLLTVFLGS